MDAEYAAAAMDDLTEPFSAAAPQPRRIYVVGTSGSGKTVLANELANLLGLEHVQLDALYWGPKWSEDREGFPERARAVASQPSWVIDGAHRAAMQAVWDRAECVVWLDYPLRTVLWRIVRRSVRRVFRQEELWHGNLERLRRVVGRRSPIVWAARSHRRLRREIVRRLAADPARQIIQLRSPGEAERWLRAVEQAPDTPTVAVPSN
jgi:adenylate kinase family enzyme